MLPVAYWVEGDTGTGGGKLKKREAGGGGARIEYKTLFLFICNNCATY